MEVTCRVMKNCPPALPVGRLVLEMGCTFEWKPGNYPSLILPDGRRVKLKVRRYVPIMDALLIATAMAGSSTGESEGDGDSPEVTTDLPDDELDDEAFNTDDDAPYSLDAATYSEDEDLGEDVVLSDDGGVPTPPAVDPEDEFPDFSTYIPEDQ